MKFKLPKISLKKILKYFIVGFSVVVLLLTITQANSAANIFEKGPKTVLAQSYWDNELSGDDGYVENPPLDPINDGINSQSSSGQVSQSPQSQAPQSQTPKAPQSQAPKAPEAPAPQQPVCQPNPRQYNECIGNGASRRVEDDGCGNYRVVVGSQADSACGTVLQPYIPAPQGAAPAQPQPQPQPAPAPVIPQSNPVAPVCVPSNVNLSVNPNPTNVGGQITFNVSGSEGSTWINDTFDGGVSNPNGFWGSRTLTANNPGTFTWTHFWQNTAPNRTDIVSPLCQKSIQFTINQPVTPTPPPAQVLCPLTISASTINVNDSVTYSLNTQNAPAGSTATWQGTNNGGSIPANPGFPVSFANQYTGAQHGGAGNYSRYIQILSNGQVVCTSNTVNLTVNQPFVPTPTPTPTPVPTPRPTPVPTVTPTPAPTTPPQGAPTLRCPEGMTQTLEGNTIVCIQNIVTNTVSQTQSQSNTNTFNPTITVPAAQVITVPQPQIVYATNPVAQQVIYATPAAQIQPKVAYIAGYDVQSLPKTGLPLAGLGLGTLLPIGLRLKRFGKAKEMLSASSLWEERQFKI